MVERTTRTEIINLGNELITGKKSDKYGRLIEPTAEVIPISNNIKLTLDGDVGAVSFSVSAKYQEATQEEDIAYFLLEVFDVNNNLLGKQKINSKDVPAKYNEFEALLSVNIDVEKFRDKAIKLRAHLKCWLETSGWVPRGGGKESVSDEDFVNITLEIPEIKKPKQNPIVSLNVIGRALRKGEKEEDYARQDIGKEYTVKIIIHNTTGNKLTYGELDLSENNNLLSYLSRGTKEILVGKIHPVIYKFTKSWDWYRVESDGKLTITDSKVREFIYKLKYYLRDEFGYEHDDVIDKPLSKVKIVVSIPQAKLDAVEVYNWSFDEEDAADKWGLVLALALIFMGIPIGIILKSVVAGAAGAAAGGAAGFGLDLGSELAEFFLGESVQSAARKLRAKLMVLITDPPKFDKNYRKVFVPRIEKLPLSKPKTEFVRTFNNIIKLKNSISANIDATVITSSRIWSAEKENNKLTIKRQKNALRKFRNHIVIDFELLSYAYKKLSELWEKLHIKFNTAEIVALKKRIKCDGLPREIRLQLQKNGFSNRALRRFESAILDLNINKSGVAGFYSNYSKHLRKLSKTLKELKWY